MKLKILLLSIFLISISCSKDDDAAPVTNTPTTTVAAVIFKTTSMTGFSFKTYYQEIVNANNRKGIVILAHGDGGTLDDGTLNEQCKALAEAGYVAATTSYRNPNQGYINDVNNYKYDIESVVNKMVTDYSISISKVIVGGASRGGDLMFPMFLPANADNSIVPTTLNIKGIILQCSGGDSYKGSAIKKQVAYMSNKNDNVFGSDATTFQSGLTTNVNANVKTLSECLIINSTGHCTNPEQYKPFVLRKVKEWLP